MIAGARLVGALALVLAAPIPALAQPAPPGRVEISFNAGWTGPAGLGSADALETRPGGGTLELFATDTTLESFFLYGPRATVRLTRTLQLEGGASIGRGSLQVEVTDDFELPDDLTIAEDIKQLLIEGGLLVQLGGRRAGARTQSFISAGGGFFWDVHEGETLSETGQQFYVGGGLTHALMLSTRPRTLKAMGIRVDGRLIARSGGAVIDDDIHLVPAFTAGFFVRF